MQRRSLSGAYTPFSSQDKPPLAIAMVVTVNGARSLKRFRLVMKSRLRLTQEVTAALASQSRDHRHGEQLLSVLHR